jgi:4-hydroxy-4-methyl-2-oxoglutarate aldolase
MTSSAEAPLTDDELARYRTFDSSTLFFARAQVEGFISEDYTDPGIHCMFPDLGPVVGYAVTSEWTTLDATSPDADFLDYYDWVAAQPHPSFAVMFDADARAGRTASFGAQQARTLKRLGVAGVLSTVALQKTSLVHAAGMPVWTTGMAPAHGSYHLVRWGAPVTIGQVTWHSGDVVFADENGAIRIPAAIARATLEQASSYSGHEQSYYDLIDAPDFTVAKLREWMKTHESLYPPVDEAMAQRWWAANGSRLAPRGSGASDRA